MADKFNPVAVASDSKVLTRRFEITGNYTYIGFAEPGTVETAARWLIQRLEDVGGAQTDWDVLYADGNDSFNSAWSNRASESYS